MASLRRAKMSAIHALCDRAFSNASTRMGKAFRDISGGRETGHISYRDASSDRLRLGQLRFLTTPNEFSDQDEIFLSYEDVSLLCRNFDSSIEVLAALR